MPLRVLVALAVALLVAAPASAFHLNLGPEQIVEAAGLPIGVDGYSVPSLVDWNEDGRTDLMVGEGSGAFAGRVRIYYNIGTASAPVFGNPSFVQADGVDLTVAGSG